MPVPQGKLKEESGSRFGIVRTWGPAVLDPYNGGPGAEA